MFAKCICRAKSSSIHVLSSLYIWSQLFFSKHCSELRPVYKAFLLYHCLTSSYLGVTRDGVHPSMQWEREAQAVWLHAHPFAVWNESMKYLWTHLKIIKNTLVQSSPQATNKKCVLLILQGRDKKRKEHYSGSSFLTQLHSFFFFFFRSLWARWL